MSRACHVGRTRSVMTGHTDDLCNEGVAPPDGPDERDRRGLPVRGVGATPRCTSAEWRCSKDRRRARTSCSAGSPPRSASCRATGRSFATCRSTWAGPAGSTTSTSTSPTTCGAPPSRPRAAAPSSTRSSVASCRSTSTCTGRCGRCGSSKASRTASGRSSPRSHHCMVDGVASVDLMALLFDFERKPAPLPEPPPWTPRRPRRPSRSPTTSLAGLVSPIEGWRRAGRRAAHPALVFRQRHGSRQGDRGDRPRAAAARVHAP